MKANLTYLCWASLPKLLAVVTKDAVHVDLNRLYKYDYLVLVMVTTHAEIWVLTTPGADPTCLMNLLTGTTG